MTGRISQQHLDFGGFVQDESGGFLTQRPVRPDEVIELARQLLESRVQRDHKIMQPSDASDYLILRFSQLEHEVFGTLWLDQRHRVIALEELFRGTIAGAQVHPRELVKSALQNNAAACIVFHNHPSGVANPSRADEQITRRLVDALDVVDVRVLDHLVVGGGATYSFAEHGLL